MKKSYILFSILFIIYSTINAQKKKENLASWYDWTDSTAFAEGPDPILKEFGPYSDSLSNAYNGMDVFVANGRYYVINTLADYYLWFIDRYPSLFKRSATRYYEFYALKYDVGLYDFVRRNYKGKHFPVPFNRSYLGYVRPKVEHAKMKIIIKKIDFKNLKDLNVEF
jgi:hypothetical protein